MKIYQFPVLVSESSKNAKIVGQKGGAVATTYASIEQSCPRSCELFQTRECYAMLGPVGMHVLRLDDSVKKLDSRGIARAERQALGALFEKGPIPQDGARGGRDLRLHTAGDARTPAAARELAGAARNWISRGGGSVWTYTHAWNKVPRRAWGPVSVLGSADRLEQIPAVVRAGYAPTAIVPTFESDKAVEINGVSMIPCPAQTRETVGCADCRLCFDDKALRDRNAGILFETHGVRKYQLGRRLSQQNA